MNYATTPKTMHSFMDTHGRLETSLGHAHCAPLYLIRCFLLDDSHFKLGQYFHSLPEEVHVPLANTFSWM